MSVNNVDKILQYLKAVNKEPIVVEYGKNTVTYDYVPEKIHINSNIFRKDGCSMCGKCDINESNVFTQSEYDKILNCTSEDFLNAGLDPEDLELLKSGVYSDQVTINGNVLQVYVFDRIPSLKRCQWQRKTEEGLNKCGIHPVESITCDMPHIRFYPIRKSATTYINTGQYGRNWALGCPIVLAFPQTSDEFNMTKNNVLRKLKVLNQVAYDLTIETYLPNIIDSIEFLDFDNYQLYTYDGLHKQNTLIDCIGNSKNLISKKLFAV